jgi:hypothetical protein
MGNAIDMKSSATPSQMSAQSWYSWAAIFFPDRRLRRVASMTMSLIF